MKLEGPEVELYRQLAEMVAEVPALPPGIRLQMLPYQVLALYKLARDFDRDGACILEIGTGHGGSAIVLSQAAPRAAIMTLTVNPVEAEIARRHLATWASGAILGAGNVEVVVSTSVDLTRKLRGHRWDMVFVDGDHNRIALDMPWFNRLRVGGLLLCHDYSPQESARPSAVVYDTLNAFAQRLGRPLDVLVMDDSRTGMAGFYRQEGESWS